MYYHTRATCKQPWYWRRECALILMPKDVWDRAYQHAESQKLGEMCSLWYSDGLEWYCAPFVHSKAVSGAEMGNGALWIHGTRAGRHRGWKEEGGPERQHMLLIKRESMVIIGAGLWLLKFALMTLSVPHLFNYARLLKYLLVLCSVGNLRVWKVKPMRKCLKLAFFLTASRGRLLWLQKEGLIV